jgi:hypothetical protein
MELFAKSALRILGRTALVLLISEWIRRQSETCTLGMRICGTQETMRYIIGRVILVVAEGTYFGHPSIHFEGREIESVRY